MEEGVQQRAQPVTEDLLPHPIPHTLGHSGAHFSIVQSAYSKRMRKEGPHAREQGEYCMLLGSKICPAVYRLTEFGYEMELLEDQKPPATEEELVSLLNGIWTKLGLDVWPAAPVDRQYRWHYSQWCNALAVWAHGYPWLDVRVLSQVYPDFTNLKLRTTHGDPTAANVLWRGQEMVLADPIPPKARVPSLVEVDMGKILQSAAGWEALLDHRWPKLDPLLPWRFVEQFHHTGQGRAAAFWAAVHCARIIPYAHGRHVAEWAESWSRSFMKAAAWG